MDGEEWKFIAGAFVGFSLGMVLAVLLFLFRGWM